MSNDGKIFEQTYTLSTNTWGSRTYIYSNGTYDARNVGGGIIGTHIYIFFALYNATSNTFISMGYIKSTDLTGTTWGAYTPIDVSPLTAFTPYSHIVQTDDPNTFLQPFYGNDGAGNYSTKYFKTTDGGSTWSVGGTIYSGTNWLDETSIEYIGNGKMIALSRMDTSGYLRQSTSSDNGATWTAESITSLGGTGSTSIPYLFYDSASGNIILIYENRSTGYINILIHIPYPQLLQILI